MYLSLNEDKTKLIAAEEQYTGSDYAVSAFNVVYPFDAFKMTIVSDNIVNIAAKNFYITELKIVNIEGKELGYNPDDNVVTIIKGGPNQTRLILEEGKRHSCYYYTDVGALTVGIYTSKIESEWSDTGGVIKARYFLDLNSIVTSTNEIIVKVKEKEKKDVESND